MLTNLGTSAAKKGKESRTRKTTTEAFFFYTKPRVNTAEAGEAKVDIN